MNCLSTGEDHSDIQCKYIVHTLDDLLSFSIFDIIVFAICNTKHIYIISYLIMSYFFQFLAFFFLSVSSSFSFHFVWYIPHRQIFCSWIHVTFSLSHISNMISFHRRKISQYYFHFCCFFSQPYGTIARSVNTHGLVNAGYEWYVSDFSFVIAPNESKRTERW